jgi:cytochrome c biogenesis protein ResB
MTFAVILILILALSALIGTILVSKDTETTYNKKTKGNIVRLTTVYAVVILISLLVVGFYISFR